MFPVRGGHGIARYLPCGCGVLWGAVGWWGLPVFSRRAVSPFKALNVTRWWGCAP